MPRAIIVAAIVAVAGGAFYWQATRPTSFDECVLAEMKGRQVAMMRFAARSCAARFPRSKLKPVTDPDLLELLEKPETS